MTQASSLRAINTIPMVPARSKCGRPAGNSASLGVLQIINYAVKADRRTRQPQGEGQEENKLTVHVEVWSLQGRCPGNLRKELHAQESLVHVHTL